MVTDHLPIIFSSVRSDQRSYDGKKGVRLQTGEMRRQPKVANDYGLRSVYCTPADCFV